MFGVFDVKTRYKRIHREKNAGLLYEYHSRHTLRTIRYTPQYYYSTQQHTFAWEMFFCFPFLLFFFSLRFVVSSLRICCFACKQFVNEEPRHRTTCQSCFGSERVNLVKSLAPARFIRLIYSFAKGTFKIKHGNESLNIR